MLLGSALLAQEPAKSGSVSVDVTDRSGGAISFARIKAMPSPVAPGEDLVADSEGKISVKLPPGTYELGISSPGFRSETRHIQVQEGAEQTIAVTLDVGSCAECVTVWTVNANLLSPERSPLAELIGGCTAREIPSQLTPAYPPYVDANKLEDTLNDVGVTVRCLLRSKKERFFKGQEGAAFYRTDAGSFDVLFMPKKKTFARLKVAERRENGAYIYSFRGLSRRAFDVDSSRPIYLVKRKNALFWVWGDQQLAANIRAKLGD
jgi:hypothetical protein